MNTKKTAEILVTSLEKVIKGKRDVIRLFITAYLSGGHVLLEDVPGVGKTTLVKTFAALLEKDGLSARFKRIQCTPDLLPYDITGVEIFNTGINAFEFMEGPIFADILLADELNRTPPKVQSALLEAMAEKQVTIGTVTHRLSPFFFTAATQNPIESLGTYPLPAAQLDRFSLCLSMGYPDEDSECTLLHEKSAVSEEEHLLPKPIVSMQAIAASREEQKTVFVHPALEKMIASLLRATREHTAFRLGVSPRAGLHLLRTARAFALINGRNWVEDEDIRILAVPVLAHRCLIKTGSGTAAELIADITEDTIRSADKRTDWTRSAGT